MLVVVVILAGIAVPTYQAVTKEVQDRATELSLQAIAGEAGAQATVRADGFDGYLSSDFDPQSESLNGAILLLGSGEPSTGFGELSVAVDPADSSVVAMAMLSKSGRCSRGSVDTYDGEFWTENTSGSVCLADLSSTPDTPPPGDGGGDGGGDAPPGDGGGDGGGDEPPSTTNPGTMPTPLVTAAGVEASGSGAGSTAGVDVSWSISGPGSSLVEEVYVMISTDPTFTASGSWEEGATKYAVRPSSETSLRFTLASGCSWFVAKTDPDQVACYPVSYGTTYYVRVQARDDNGSGTTWVMSATVDVTPYTTPGASTVSGMTSAASTSFVFAIPDTGGSEIIDYDYEIASSSTFSDAVTPTIAGLDPSTEDAGAWWSHSRAVGAVGGSSFDDVEYHRIRFRNAAGWGPWSNNVIMRTALAPIEGLNVQLAIEEPRDAVSNNVSMYAAWDPVPDATRYEFRVWVDGLAAVHGYMAGPGADDPPGLYLDGPATGSYDFTSPHLYATGLEHGRSFRVEVRACVNEPYPSLASGGSPQIAACSAWSVAEPTQSKSTAWTVRQGTSTNYPTVTSWVDTVGGRRAWFGENSEPASGVGFGGPCVQVPSDATYTMADGAEVFYQEGDHRFGGCEANSEFRFRTDSGVEPPYVSTTNIVNGYTYQTADVVTCSVCTELQIIWSPDSSGVGWSSWQIHPDIDTALGSTPLHSVAEASWGSSGAGGAGVWVYVWDGSTWVLRWHTIEVGTGLPWAPVSYEGSFSPRSTPDVEIHVRLLTEAQSEASAVHSIKTSETSLAFDIWATGNVAALDDVEVYIVFADSTLSYPTPSDLVGGATLPPGYLAGYTSTSPRRLGVNFNLDNPSDVEVSLWGRLWTEPYSFAQNSGASAIRRS